jgi:UDP-glucose 4-epimerase
MKILITGGSGFIGSHLADRLLARGDELLIIDNYATGRRDNLKPQKNLTIVEDTIADEKRMQELFDLFIPDVVVHTAASYKDPDNFVEDARTNVMGGAIIVKNSQRLKVKRLVYFQTALCYGKPLAQPIPIDHPLNIDMTSYAVSKTGGEFYIRLSGLDFISFRLANVYGPRNISGPLPTFFTRLTACKPCFVVDTRRDFVYVDDLVDIAEMAVDGKGKKGEYNVSSGKDCAIKELFDKTVKALGITLEKEVEVRPRSADDAATILLDPSKTHRDFGWKAKTALEDGVSKAISYYREFGITQTYTHLRQEPEKEGAKGAR